MVIENIFDFFSTLKIIFYVISITLSVATYVYFSLTLMLTAKRLEVKHIWLAWIPLINIYLFPKMAKKPTWPLAFIFTPFLAGILFGLGESLIGFKLEETPSLIIAIILGVISLIGIIYLIYWFVKILKNREKPWWWILLILIPLFGFVWIYIMWGILAWSKKEGKIKSFEDKRKGPSKILVEYLRKYKAEGYTLEELREHLINSGQNTSDIDEAIRYI